MQDSFGNTVTTASTEALRLIEAAIDMHARAWPGALDAAQGATREDPQMAIAHALEGLIHAMWGRRSAADACMSMAASMRRRASVDCVVTVLPNESCMTFFLLHSWLATMRRRPRRPSTNRLTKARDQGNAKARPRA